MSWLGLSWTHLSTVKYEYMVLVVSVVDKHTTDVGKRRRGQNVDRKLVITDVGRNGTREIHDRDGDDWAAFIAHTREQYLVFLNGLGQAGWRLVDSESPHASNWPSEHHTFIKESGAGDDWRSRTGLSKRF